MQAADAYERLEQQEREPQRVADHSAKLAQLHKIADCNGAIEERVRVFCQSKRISREALVALDTRVRTDRHGGVELAWGYQAGRNGKAFVSAIKYRPLGDKPRYAEDPSVFVEPIVIGNRLSLEWFVAEGETDAARLYDLVGDVAAILLLPAGALTFKPEWAASIPRGATVHLCHDADEAGDKGAAKAASVLGGHTVRVRPPVEGTDWCDWGGDSDEFFLLVTSLRGSERRHDFVPLDAFLAYKFPLAEPLLGEPGAVFLAVGSLLLVYGADGTGKSTWTIDGIAHLAAGVPWLSIPVPRPVRFCVIENEGPPSLFQEKLRAKAQTWRGPAWTQNVTVYRGPWGEFSFASPDARFALTAFCEEQAIDVVVANPTLRLGVAGSGRPEETDQFVSWLVECGLYSNRAFWLLHHENKGGQISGDWGRQPDTKVQLQADGNHPRTKLIWGKTRWATLPTDEHPKAVMLEWATETESYTVTQLDTVGATDSELEERIAAFLTDHPWSSTNAVLTGVKGTNSRIRELLNGEHFDSVKGLRGATNWANYRVEA